MNFSIKKTGGRMWHEARKQEKKIRGMLVDYKRRAERRRDYYEKIVSKNFNKIYNNSTQNKKKISLIFILEIRSNPISPAAR